MGTIKAFLSKIRTVFWFSKRAGEAFHLLLSCAPVSMAEYASISLNMPKYPWKSLNKLFWLPGLGICMIISPLYMQRLRRFPNMSDYYSIRRNNAWICLNMPQCPSICLSMSEYCWMSLNMPENAWINCSDYARVFNMPRHSYNNIIIIVTNVIILESLSAQFVHPGTLLSFYFILTWVKNNNKKMTEARKLLKSFSFLLKWRQSFQSFKWTAGCIFKCETTKMKLPKNIKKGFLSKNAFV